AVTVVGGATAAIVELTGSSNARAIPSAAGSRLLGLGYRARAAALATSLPATPAAIASGDGSLWLADPNDDVALRVNPTTGAVAPRIPVDSQPGSLALGGGAVWAAGTLGGTIDRIDPSTDTVSQTIHLGGADTSAVAFGRHALWVADTTDHALVEIDPRTGS